MFTGRVFRFITRPGRLHLPSVSIRRSCSKRVLGDGRYRTGSAGFNVPTPLLEAVRLLPGHDGATWHPITGEIALAVVRYADW